MRRLFVLLSQRRQFFRDVLQPEADHAVIPIGMRRLKRFEFGLRLQVFLPGLIVASAFGQRVGLLNPIVDADELIVRSFGVEPRGERQG